MSSFTHNKPVNRDYGKTTGTHIRSGDRYGNQRRNIGASTTGRRENNPPLAHDDISVGPPQWLDSYLEDFKRKLISEITDDVMKALDVSYQNDSNKRRFKTSYFALKKRLEYYEGQKNTENVQKPYSNQTNNYGNKSERQKPQEKFYRSHNGRNENDNKISNEPVISSSDSKNITDDLSPSLSKVINDQQEQSVEYVEKNDATKITEKLLETNIDNNDMKKDVAEEAAKQDQSDSNSNETITTTRETVSTIMNSIETISEVLENNTLDKEGTQEPHTKEVKTDMMNSLCELIQSMLNNITFENFDVGSAIKKLEIDTLEKQQDVVKVFVKQAIDKPMYSTIYAQMCKKISIEYECLDKICQVLITQCDAELTRYKEMKTIKLMGVMAAAKFDDGKNVDKISTGFDLEISYEFIGFVRFIGELYNQELLTDTVIEKYLQYFLQTGGEDNLEYMCHILRIIGKNFMLRKKSIAPYMNYLVEVRETNEISENLTMLINSVVELMANSWKPVISDVSSEATEFEDAIDE